MKFARVMVTNIFMFLICGLVFRNQISENRPEPNEIYPSYFLLNFYFIQAQGTLFVNATCAILSGIFSVALIFPVER